MGRLTFYCWHCYGENRAERGACTSCGKPIETPANASYVDCLLWALDHPVAERRTIAARVLGELREHRAADRLWALAHDSSDPFLAAQALKSVIEIEGVENLAQPLAELAASAPVGVRQVARDALASQTSRGPAR